MPLFTVLMPVYDAEKYVSSAIKSILNQTLSDFELLIIDDGSKDRSAEIIHSFSDKRIRYIKNEQNLKIIRTLNLGLKAAKGLYIARMDADDISFPQRLQRQAEFFKEHSRTDVLGSYAIKINGAGINGALIKRPLGKRVAETIWLPTPLLHPTVTMKSTSVRDFQYDETALHCEDYDLWIRLQQSGLVLDNYPAPLLYYRVHSGGVSAQNRALQLENSFKVFKKYFTAQIDYDEYQSLIGVKSKISLMKRLKLSNSITMNGNLDIGTFAFLLNLHFKTLLLHR